MTSAFAIKPAERILRITRLFDAPRALVFDAFVDPKQALCWLGPRGYAMTHMEADLRVGGRWRGCMRADVGGPELWHGGIYREIVRPERLAFTFAWETANADPETLVTVTFAEQGHQTLMRFTQGVFETPETCEGYRGGWESEFDQLAALFRGS